MSDAELVINTGQKRGICFCSPEQIIAYGGYDATTKALGVQMILHHQFIGDFCDDLTGWSKEVGHG